MTSRIFRSTVLIAAVILLCSLVIVVGVFYGYANDVQVTQLKDELNLAAIGTEQSGIDFLNQVESERFRVTWVQADGSVLYDSHADAKQMQRDEHCGHSHSLQRGGYRCAAALKRLAGEAGNIVRAR